MERGTLSETELQYTPCLHTYFTHKKSSIEEGKGCLQDDRLAQKPLG